MELQKIKELPLVLLEKLGHTAAMSALSLGCIELIGGRVEAKLDKESEE